MRVRIPRTQLSGTPRRIVRDVADAGFGAERWSVLLRLHRRSKSAIPDLTRTGGAEVEKGPMPTPGAAVACSDRAIAGAPRPPRVRRRQMPRKRRARPPRSRARVRQGLALRRHEPRFGAGCARARAAARRRTSASRKTSSALTIAVPGASKGQKTSRRRQRPAIARFSWSALPHATFSGVSWFASLHTRADPQPHACETRRHHRPGGLRRQDLAVVTLHNPAAAYLDPIPRV